MKSVIIRSEPVCGIQQLLVNRPICEVMRMLEEVQKVVNVEKCVQYRVPET